MKRASVSKGEKASKPEKSVPNRAVNRKVQLKIMLSPDEKLALFFAAQNNHCTVSEYVRSFIREIMDLPRS